MNGRLALLFLLLLFEEVDDEVLVIPDEVVRQAFGFQVVSKMLPPLRVEGFQGSKLGRRLVSVRAVADTSRGRPRIMRVCARRRWRKVGTW